METTNLEQQLQDIRGKLDEIGEELAVARRQREEMRELKDDLSMIAKDVFQTAVIELEDIAPFVQTGDFIHLMKKILRNTTNISNVISKFESAIGFFEDGTPIGQELFNDALEKLDSMDRSGYFIFLKEIGKIFDNIVTHFDAKDVRLLADNIVGILETVKNLTQPEMLKALDNALVVYESLDPDDVEEYTLWKAFREMNTPEMRRGLGFLVSFMKNVSKKQITQA